MALTEPEDDDVVAEEEVEIWEVETWDVAVWDEVVVAEAPDASEACRVVGSSESDALPR